MGIHVEAPDGRVFDVNAATEDEARAKVRTYIAANPAPARQAPTRRSAERGLERADAAVAATVTTAWDERGNPIDTQAVQAWDEHGRPILAQRASPTRRPAPSASRTAVNTLRTFNNWLLPGLSGTYEGGVRAVGAALRGRDPMAAFSEGRAANEAGQADLRATNPALSIAAGAAGGVIPGLLTGGAATDASVASTLRRGPVLNFARNAATGAAANAPFGVLDVATDGRNTDVSSPQAVLSAMATGPVAQHAAMGAIAAPVIGVAADHLAPLAARGMSAIGRRLPDVRVDPNVIGANGGNLRLVPPAPRTVREGVSQNIVRLARRERLTPADIDASMAQHAEAGSAPLTAQVLGESGLQRGQTLASLPGQTPRRAADTIRARQRGQREGVEGLFDRAAPGRLRSPTQAEEALETARQRVNRDAFTPALSQTPNPDVQPRIDGILQRFPPRVLERANKLVDDLAHIDGVEAGQMTPGQRLYYTKRALSGSIEEMSREGLNADMRAALSRLSSDYVGALQDSMPGLRPAMERFARVARAKEAMEAGQAFMRQNVDDLNRLRTSASDLEREYAEVGWRDYVNSVLDRNRDGHANVAEMFASDGFRRRTEALLGPERAGPLLRALRTRSQEFRDVSSMTPRGNSKTAPMFADLLDQASAIPRKLSVGGAVEAALSHVTSSLAEHSRNIEGRVLFSTMTPERALALKQALIDAGIRLRPIDLAAPTAAGTSQAQQ